MFLSRATLKPVADIGHFIRMTCRGSYQEHQMLWNFFPSAPNADRDFLFRYDLHRGILKYFIVSKRKPRDEHGMWTIEAKKFDPCIRVSEKLAFVLRANPVITIKNNKGKAKRHDVVMHEKYCMGYKVLPKEKRPSLQQIAAQGGFKWLSSRAENCGFTISKNEVSVEGYQQQQARRNKQKKLIQYSILDFRGTLTVSDPDNLRNMLFFGIGKAKAFGCGLMLVRRV